MPRITIIAGPNGAGKTTFAEEYLTQEALWPTFLNADVIAQHLRPEDPAGAAFAAGRVMVRRLAEGVRRGEALALETTLSGLAYARWIPAWRRQGYRVELIYLRLPIAEFAVARVRQRVAQGGHSIPEAVVRRRFERSRRNFDGLYRPLVDAWAEYDGSERPAALRRNSGTTTGTRRVEFPALSGIEAAMKRAGERALRRAAETTGATVGWRDGGVVSVPVPADDPLSAATDPAAFGRPVNPGGPAHPAAQRAGRPD